MTESITGMAKYGKYLALLLERRIVVTHNNGEEPNKWPQQHFSDVGTDNAFVRELAVDFRVLLHGSSISGTRREAVESALMAVLVEGLLPAFGHLQDIENSSRQTALIKQMQQVEDFTSALWRAYKTLFPKLTLLLGFDIGFLFVETVNFEKGASIFISTHPHFSGVVDFLRIQRTTWQDGLKDFRNHCIEHRNVPRERFPMYYAPGHPRQLFENVWNVIDELTLVFLASHLRFNGIQRVSETEQDPLHRCCFKWL